VRLDRGFPWQCWQIREAQTAGKTVRFVSHQVALVAGNRHGHAQVPELPRLPGVRDSWVGSWQGEVLKEIVIPKGRETRFLCRDYSSPMQFAMVCLGDSTLVGRSRWMEPPWKGNGGRKGQIRWKTPSPQLLRKGFRLATMSRREGRGV